jgi:CHAT domain-containing protein
LSALISARDYDKSQKFKLLLVAQPDAPGLSKIPGTLTELKQIQKVVGRHPVVTRIGPDATKDRILNDMSECTWAHFACHGVQDSRDPDKSRLFLHNSTLELSEITKKSFPNSELAFLSACETASGDTKVSEEAVHLAAGMLLAGYRGVVATMWSILDQTTPQIAEDFYRPLLENHSPNLAEAAKSLHEAVRHLRDGNAPLASWVPFIHIGM